MSHAPGGGGEYRSRIGVITLELGPGPSPRELLGALGDALVRSELRTLIRSSARDDAEPRDPRFRRRQCSLAG